ncbi:hypothetical protein Are01nite_10680 [Actinoplanes regularis]|nr:hypothetical protein Are01nite_10680 [Actinoplanes regularis]
MENVPALLGDADAFGWMLGDLAEDGFDADWTLLSACALGAPHSRERLFVVAYANGVARSAAVPRKVLANPAPSRCIEGADRRGRTGGDPWTAEPDVGRVAHGVPARVDRLRGLGNAVVPQLGELVGRLIRDHAQQNLVLTRAIGDAV